MEFKFVPECCKGENPSFAGHIMITPPNAAERLEYSADCNISFDDSGKTRLSPSNLKAMAFLMRASEKHCKSVEITRIEDGVKFSSWADLINDSSCDPIMSELAQLMLKGFSPSKK